MRQMRKAKLATTLKYILLSIPLSFCFATMGYTKDVTLMWYANTESNLEGYKIYYDSDSGYPYEGIGAMEGDSPIIIINELNDPEHPEYTPENPEYTIHGLDDQEDYYFVLTAYDIEGYESGYSNEVDTLPNSSGGGCFIATEAYGYPIEPYGNVLRGFRDRFLLSNRIGKIFMDFYCTYSPQVAGFIKNNDGLRAISHVLILPVVGVSWVALKLGTVSTMALMIFFGIGLTCFIGFRRKFKQ